ncbi:MAG TPA: copper chaperone PCu(A)C [Sphingomonadaceae bacterium]|nr:copper chaperone PCu(A)C [Sphingomonadaceae bacterium]HTN40869.1 copper chaperone PCu(A)C [Asticcacaulis sp.]
MKSVHFAAAALALVSLSLGACQQEAAEPAAEDSMAAPEAPAGVALANGRLVLPAVKGNPGAVYFDIANKSENDLTIVGVHVDGAGSAMMHQTMNENGMSSMKDMSEVAVPKGGSAGFKPGGNHVMAMELADTLTPGTSTEVTLTFGNGDKASFTAEVFAAGDAR